MNQISLVALASQGVFTAISALRTNEKEYPFVTLITKDSKATNVYFGKKSGALLMGKYDVGQRISKELVDAKLVLVQNEAGESRYKISLTGDSEYESVEEIFGITTESDFDVAAFRKEFQAAQVAEGAQEPQD